MIDCHLLCYFDDLVDFLDGVNGTDNRAPSLWVGAASRLVVRVLLAIDLLEWLGSRVVSLALRLDSWLLLVVLCGLRLLVVLLVEGVHLAEHLVEPQVEDEA